MNRLAPVFFSALGLVGSMGLGCGDSGSAGSLGSADGVVAPGDGLSGGDDSSLVDAIAEAGPTGERAVEDAAPAAEVEAGPDAPPEHAGPTPEQLADMALTEAVFDRDRLLDIHIEMEPDDWDELRQQTRTLLDVLGPGCLDGPPVSPFTYFDASVTIDGTTVHHVGLRKKGFLGSMSTSKPALKVKFGEYVKNQTWEGMRRLTLNNSVQDPAIVRQCLSFDLFERAGLPTPRCNFAMVTVNGEYLGPYVHVESLKKPFLRRAFGSDDGLFWEGTLSDFREGWNKTFQPKNTDHPDPSNAPLEAIEAALDVPDDQLEAALDEVMVLDEFFTFWAAELLVTHWDGYAGNTNNFYVYTDPAYDGRARFVPWGVDGTLRAPNPDAPTPKAVLATGILARRLYAYAPTRARYLARLQELLDTVWDEDQMVDDANAIIKLLDPAIDPPYTAPFIEEVYRVKQMIEGRRAMLQPEIDLGGLDWPGPLRDAICMQEVGAIDVSFDTTFGTLGTDNPLGTGSASAEGILYDNPVSYLAAGAIAGIPTDGPDAGRVIIGSFFHLGDDGVAVLVLNTSPDLFTAPSTLPIGGGGVDSALILIDPATGEGQPLGYFLGATLELEAADTTPGSPTKGTASGPLYMFGG